MKLVETRGELLVVELAAEECRIIRQALNEVCNGLDIDEFGTRMGAERSEVRDLLERFGGVTRTPGALGGG